MESDVLQKEMQKKLEGKKEIKIFLIGDNGKIRSVNRTCDLSEEKSCFEYAIKELILAPSKWEKTKGFTSEIPQSTKILSVREDENSIRIDLSSDFEAGGGTESTYTRVKQLIKTANSNTKTPTYLYINGRQVNVIGGDGIMIKRIFQGEGDKIRCLSYNSEEYPEFQINRSDIHDIARLTCVIPINLR